MMGLAAALAVAALSLSATAPAQPPAPVPSAGAITLPFAPPTGRAMRYEMTQLRSEAGRRIRSTAVREVRFDPDGDHFTMTMRVSEATTDAPGPAGEAFREAMAALSGIDFRFRVDRTGKVGALVNFSEIRARLSAGGDRRPETVFARLLAMPDSQLDRIMRLDAEQLLAYAGRPIDPARPESEESSRPSPLGGTVSIRKGTRWTVSDAEDPVEHVDHRSGDSALRDLIVALRVQRDAAAEPTARAQLNRSLAAVAPLWFEETTETRLSRHWGLPVEMKRVTKAIEPSGEVQVEEIRRFGDFLR